jgi:hypothetical protein
VSGSSRGARNGGVRAEIPRCGAGWDAGLAGPAAQATASRREWLSGVGFVRLILPSETGAFLAESAGIARCVKRPSVYSVSLENPLNVSTYQLLLDMEGDTFVICDLQFLVP